MTLSSILKWALLASLLHVPLAAQERYALIVSGASGGATHAEAHAEWRATMVAALHDRLGFEPANVLVLAEPPAPHTRPATREEVAAALRSLRGAMGPDDLLFLVLIGHGTFDGIDAKFNLVGPDLEAAEWAELLRGMPGRQVIVNTASASFPFLEQLAGPGRVVITATDSAAQRFETVFPRFFVRAFEDPSADIDKNGRISIWEAFAFASARVRQYYEQRGQLPTERALIDDDGDGVGKEADAPGPDGAVAARTYLDAAAHPVLTEDPALGELYRRRAALEAEVEGLKQRKPLLPPAEYQRELERALIDLARVSKALRDRSD